jgi:hypothetical protein
LEGETKTPVLTTKNKNMKLSNLKRAHDFDVRNYLKERYQLSDYQWEKMYDDEFPRHSGFFVFTYEKQKNSGLLWRLTLPLIIPYYLIILLYVLIKWLITGDRYLSEKSQLIKFHRKWVGKLGIDWI